ncbi:hypothetical protein Tco_0755882 [Tanacetum coccineum]
MLSKTAASTAVYSLENDTSRLEPAAFIFYAVPNNNWASAIASSFVSPPENSLLSHTGDIGVFTDWFCKNQGITELTLVTFWKVLHMKWSKPSHDVIHLPISDGECHKLLIIQLVVTKDYSALWLSLTGVQETAILHRAHSADTTEEYCQGLNMRILSVVSIEVFSLYGYDYMKKIVLRRADNQEYIIAESDFKDLYPSDFEDLILVIRKMGKRLPGRYYREYRDSVKPHQPRRKLQARVHARLQDLDPTAVVFRDRYGMQMIMRFNEIHKFSDETLQQIDEALNYQVKEFKVNKVNPGLNTRFWTKNDVIKSKQFMFAIQKRLKLRRIFRNLESFIGGRIREGDYRLLQRTE